MRLSKNLILLFYFILIISSCSSTGQKEKKDNEEVFLCNVEDIDDQKKQFKEVSEKNLFFSNINTQSGDFSYSGKFSSKLYPGSPYGLTTDLSRVKPDDYIQVTAWRKSKNNSGVLVVDGGNGYYSAKKQVVEEGTNGWKKIFLEYHVPPNFYSGKIKIYVWNNNSDTVYFDDLQIIHRNKKVFPEYNVPTLQIHTDELVLNKFKQKRLQAFETTVLVSSNEDYANMVLYAGKDFLNGSFRLKGDLVDHIQGQKWSFRIKLKKDFAWNNMRTFSIQNPATRNFLYEWIAHKVFKQEDVLTTRYGFVPVKLNNESLGIYAWEEHFEKQLIENQNRREGPIVRFDESLFWQRVLETNQTKREWDIDYFGAAKIIPFKEGRTSKDSLLNLQLVEAQKLLLQYKNRSKLVSQIFDINKLAKYYALIDITQAYHGFTWHNQRFYYNPVTCLLEPIAFDGYIEGGIYKRIDEQITGLLLPDKIASFNKEELMLFQVFTDNLFRKKYIGFLKKYSTPGFINQLISEFQPQADSISTLIKQEFPYYKFNFNYIKRQAEYIQNNIEKIESNIEKIGLAVSKITPEKFKKEYTSDINNNLIPFQIHAYFNKKKKQIDVLNFHNAKVKILGAFMEGGLPESFEEKPELESYNGVAPPKISIPTKGVPLKILFEIGIEMFETEVSQWPFYDSETSRQIVVRKQLPENIHAEGKSIVFEGNYQFKTDVVIPGSFVVIAKPGTQIDLIEGASFISFAPIQFLGTEENPIVITSSDKSANGFNILQPQGKSELKYVIFSGLGSLRKAGWETPAAVAFYEADIVFENCTFSSNINCDDALNTVRSKFLVANCKFENTFADAFDSDFSTGKVVNCTFKNIGNDAIDFSGSSVTISGCKMSEISDKAISGGENSTLIVSNCEIDKANIGVAAKDLSNIILDKITMNNTVYGLVAFVKKPEYGPATLIVDNLKMKNNVIFYQIELGSTLTLDGKIIEGREKNLAVKLYQ
ncbi:MAG: CotH kinase family protein [Draconibacterium sp.]|nr:CotH kinase family protein [Draconibacterium sp.]